MRWFHWILTKEERRTITLHIIRLYLFCHGLQQFAVIGQKEKCCLLVAGLWVNKGCVGGNIAHCHTHTLYLKVGSVELFRLYFESVMRPACHRKTS